MGFPTIYYCVILPTPLVVLLQILDLIRLSLSTALSFLGVRCPMLELPALPSPPQPVDGQPYEVGTDVFAYDRLYPLSDTPSSSPQLPTPSSIKRRLPVVRYATLRRSPEASSTCRCPICLCGLEARHQVRLLDNCRHVFHKDCIDQWVDQGQSTCPLCRSRLLTRYRGRKEPREGLLDDDAIRHRSSSWFAGSVLSLFHSAGDSAYSVAPSSPSSLLSSQ